MAHPIHDWVRVMTPASTGYGPRMEERDRPTTNQPLNAPGPRPKLTPLLAVLGMVVLVAVVFASITLLRYNT